VDAVGNFYGTTSSCGTHVLGTVWEVSKTGKERLLHSFAGGTTDGEYPLAGVIVDAAGNLYGNTETGGAAHVGTVYEISKSGKFTLLHASMGQTGNIPTVASPRMRRARSSAQPRMAVPSATGRCGRSRSSWDTSRYRRGSELAELSSGCIRDYRYGTF